MCIKYVELHFEVPEDQSIIIIFIDYIMYGHNAYSLLVLKYSLLLNKRLLHCTNWT